LIHFYKRYFQFKLSHKHQDRKILMEVEVSEVEVEYFNLKCDQFRGHISTGLQELRNSNIFFDVTLACETGQVGAHRAVLSAFSSFFRNILVTFHHQHPLVYLKGVTMEEITKILDFMYCGEVSVHQDLLSSFLAAAKELKVVGFQNHDRNMLKIGSSLEPVPYPPGTKSCAENTEGDNVQMGIGRSVQNVQKESCGQIVQEEGYGPMTGTESCDKIAQVQEVNTGLAQVMDICDNTARNIPGSQIVTGSCKKSVQESRSGHAIVKDVENNTVHEDDVLGREDLETSQVQYRPQLKKAVVRLPKCSVNIPPSLDSNVQGIIEASGENNDGDDAIKVENTEHEIGGTDTQGENSNSGSGYVAGSSEKTDQKANSSRRILRKRKSKTKAELNTKSSSTIKSKMFGGKIRTNKRSELDSRLVQCVSLSPCSPKSGPKAGSLKSRTKNIVEYVERRDDDVSSNSSSKSGLVFHGPRKKTQLPRMCTICGVKFIRLERHILLAHKTKQPETSVDSDSDGRIYFSIATKELSEDGKAIEDLPCGMKPETTVKQIKKSYCKRFGWERDKTRLQLGGRYLWEGQTVGGFEGVTIIAVKIG